MSAKLAKQRDPIEGLTLLAGIVGLMWVVEGINSLDGNGLDNAGGIYPRSVDHLWAIFTSPFLHANFYPHLVDNTIPLLFMGVIIALRGAARLAVVTLIVIVIGGLGTWLIAPAGTDTIGASGIVFGYATYLLTRGVFDRSVLEILVGLVVGVVWGGALIASLVPQHGVSWQAHASGAVAGVIAAWLLTRGRANQTRTTGATGASGPAGGSLDRALAK
jgi:membrane associated rhomboid family serine protease